VRILNPPEKFARHGGSPRQLRRRSDFHERTPRSRFVAGQATTAAVEGKSVLWQSITPRDQLLQTRPILHLEDWSGGFEATHYRQASGSISPSRTIASNSTDFCARPFFNPVHLGRDDQWAPGRSEIRKHYQFWYSLIRPATHPLSHFVCARHWPKRIKFTRP